MTEYLGPKKYFGAGYICGFKCIRPPLLVSELRSGGIRRFMAILAGRVSKKCDGTIDHLPGVSGVTH